MDANNSPAQLYKVVTVGTDTIQRRAYESEKYHALHVTQYGVSTARPQR